VHEWHGEWVTCDPNPCVPIYDGFAGCSSSDDCFAFDLVTHNTGGAIDLLPEGDYPYDATICPDYSEVWFVGASGDGAVVIDRATHAIMQRIEVGDYPTSVAFSNDGGLALVSNRLGESVSVVDTDSYQVTSTLPLPAGYQGGNIALDPVSGRFYLVDWFDNTLFEIAGDGSSILRQVDLGNGLWQLVVSPDGQYIYITDRGTDDVRVIEQSTLTEVHTVAVGDDPWGIDITQDGTKLVVTCEDSHDVYLVEAGTWIATVVPLDTEADPRDVDILDGRQQAFVTGGTMDPDGTIYAIDLADGSIETSFEGPGLNPNVIAVQAQMHSFDINAIEEIADVPSPLGLTVFPNPFRSRVVLSYSVPTETWVELILFDPLGRKVRALDSGWRAPGAHQIVWDARDGASRPLGSGVYLLRLDAGGNRRSLKLIVNR
jgi:YVTN family beta-propeller protein